MGALELASELLAGLGLLGIGALGAGRCSDGADSCRRCRRRSRGDGSGDVTTGVFTEGLDQLQYALLVHQLGLLGVAAGGLELAGELLAGLAFLGAAQDRAGLSIEWGQGGEASGQEQQDWDGAEGGHRQGWAGSS